MVFVCLPPDQLSLLSSGMTVNLASSARPYFEFRWVAHCCGQSKFNGDCGAKYAPSILTFVLLPMSSVIHNLAVPHPLMGIFPPTPER